MIEITSWELLDNIHKDDYKVFPIKGEDQNLYAAYLNSNDVEDVEDIINELIEDNLFKPELRNVELGRKLQLICDINYYPLPNCLLLRSEARTEALV